MFLKLITFVSSITILAVSCHTNKKAQSIANEPAIQLDTIKVIANETPKKQTYQASNPIGFDIIHTRLDVNFPRE